MPPELPTIKDLENTAYGIFDHLHNNKVEAYHGIVVLAYVLGLSVGRLYRIEQAAGREPPDLEILLKLTRQAFELGLDDPHPQEFPH